MTVANTNTDVTYLGDGATMRFPITFSFDKKEDVYVMRVDAAGREYILTQDYFIDTASSNADVFYPGYPPGEEPPEGERPPVLPDGEKLFIFRGTPHTQEQPFPDTGIIGNVRKAVDKLTMMVQELTTDIRHAIVLPQSSRFEGQLPAPVKPNSSIMTNADGTGLKYGGDADKAQSDAEYAVGKVNELQKLIDNAQIGDARTLGGETGTELKADAVEAALEGVALGYYNKDEVDDKVIGVYRFKGSVPAYDDLPATGQEAGDVWDVLDTGKNYGWTGAKWDDLGGISLGGGGKEIGEIFPWPFESAPPVGSLYLDTIVRRREDYPELWAKASKEPQLKTDVDYLAMVNEVGFCPFFSSGDGLDTFRTPSQPPYIRGGSEIGYMDDAVGPIEIRRSPYSARTQSMGLGSSTAKYGLIGGLDSSGGDEDYGQAIGNTNITIVRGVKNADETRTKSFVYPWYIKATAGYINPEQTDITAAMNKIDSLLDSVGFTYIYPNGGTEESPANVTVNQRYVMANPYPGYYIDCRAEVFYKDKWCETKWYSDNANRIGVIATHLKPDDVIVVQTGSQGTIYNSDGTGNGFGENNGIITTALPCRVKVWKIGGVTSRKIDVFVGKETQIIYPNDGNAETPANITTNTRYVEDNPFPGYYVHCEAQLQIDGKWGQTGYAYGAGLGGHLTIASQLLPDDKIIVQTGASRVMTSSTNSGNPFGNTNEPTTAPCRVIVTRLGAIG